MVENDYVTTLEACKRQSLDGSDYWMARDLQPLLGYEQWRNFAAAIERAMEACANAGVTVSDQFAEASKMIDIAKGAKRETTDWFLSRYACYLIAMNGDVSKPEVAAAQTYFAVRTRQQEMQDKLTDTQRKKDGRDDAGKPSGRDEHQKAS